VAVGTVIALIGVPHPTGPAGTPVRPPRHHHSPLVRRLAQEAGLDPDSIVGQVREAGRTLPTSCVRWLNVPPHRRPRSRSWSLRTPTVVADQGGAGGQRRAARADERLRSIIAERMMTSLATSAQLTCVMEVDLSGIVRLRPGRAGNRRCPSQHDRVLRRRGGSGASGVPLLNASIDGDGRTIVHRGRHNIGIAVDTAKGLSCRSSETPAISACAGCRDASRTSPTAPIRHADAGRPVGRNLHCDQHGSRGALFDTPILVRARSASWARVRSSNAGCRTPIHRGAGNRHPRHGPPRTHLRPPPIDGADAARFLMFIKQRLEIERADVEAW
jgi:2-oxoglutarate dehydrogenase E2 component (dihydrolipoamide succinyltransferase)